MSSKDRGTAARSRNPLVTRVVATGVTVAALGMFGMSAPAYAADTLVIEDFLAVADAEPGQQIAVAPSTMDLKVREAVLIAMPLAFSDAERAGDEFAAMSPVSLGSAEVGRNFYSGSTIAAAGAELIPQLSLPPEKVDAVTTHFKNLVALGNAITVNAEPAEPPPPPPAPPPEPAPEPEPSPSPTPDQPPAPDGEVPVPSEPPSTPDLPPNAVPGAYPGYGGQSVPGFSFAPKSLTPWEKAEFGQPPGVAPDAKDMLRKEQEKDRQDEVRAAGSAEAMPAEASRKVALPVLMAAFALAVVTAGLVRTWVLRRT